MRRAVRERLLYPILAGIFVLTSSVSFARDPAGYVLANGIGVYYAILPAEMIRGYPEGAPEFDMHGGAPAGKHYHHVMVALFEGKSLERVTDADVVAAVGEIGLAETTKRLEPMPIGGALSYGAYFNFRDLGTYRITLRIRRPGWTEAVATSFEYDHH